ncbi:hypothetical protein IE53DRAFT_82815 [Violaceomyces palustris]|uniref:Uncharacterized protein n=1 Tax=Violaceomyces palustris TaxID=1673888 RepID=A0ACD0NY30_9BASI|nr:hypothetical protein IE53DRAFT_82815 [Violaceomyces palustris]
MEGGGQGLGNRPREREEARDGKCGIRDTCMHARMGHCGGSDRGWRWVPRCHHPQPPSTLNPHLQKVFPLPPTYLVHQHL